MGMTDNNKGNKYFASVTYLRLLKGIKFEELAKMVGVSRYWLKKKIMEGNEDYLNKVYTVLENL